MTTRREFIQRTVMAGASLALFRAGLGRAWAFAQSPRLRKFIAPLPVLGPTGLPIASATANAAYPGADFYHLVAQQFSQQMHPDLANSTTLWGYSDATASKQAYLGPIIVAQCGVPTVIRMVNKLPSRHILPVDNTLMGADSATPQNRICVHLHGAPVQWTSDGGPYTWYSPTGVVGANDGSAGPCFLNGVAGLPGAADYYYPNNQSARLMWYHDHAMGITRLNAYAGMAAGYLITDAVVTNLTSGNAPIVPPLAYTLPLIIQDKSFKMVADQWGQPGDLWYPFEYEANQTSSSGRWDVGQPADGFTSAGPMPLTRVCLSFLPTRRSSTDKPTPMSKSSPVVTGLSSSTVRRLASITCSSITNPPQTPLSPTSATPDPLSSRSATNAACFPARLSSIIPRCRFPLVATATSMLTVLSTCCWRLPSGPI